MMKFASQSRLLLTLAAPTLPLLLWPAFGSFGQSSLSVPQPARNGTRGPSAFLFTPDGKTLYVAEQDENDIAVVDSRTGNPTAHIPSGGDQPTALAATPDGRTLVVANTFSGSVGILDTEKQAVRARILLLGEPSGVVVTSGGKAFVSLAQLDQIAVIDVNKAGVTARIPVGRCPQGLALTPDGKTVLCANSLGGSLSVIDAATGREQGRIAIPAINLRGMAITPDSKRVYVTGQQPHNEAPTERTETMFSNVVFAVRLIPNGRNESTLTTGKTLAARHDSKETNPASLDTPVAAGQVERMLVLDRAEEGAADPCGVVLDPREQTAYVTLSGTHDLAIVPIQASYKCPTSVGKYAFPSPIAQEDMPTKGDSSPKTTNEKAPVGKSMTYPVWEVGNGVRRIRVGCVPRALALRPHSSELWLGNHLGNSLNVFPELPGNLSPGGAATKDGDIRTFDLGAPSPSPNRRLKGRFFFASAHVTRGQFFSCESCHPNGTADGLSWKFAHVKDNIGTRNTRDLRGLLLLTGPYGWGGREEDFEIFVHDEVGGLLRTRKLQHPEVHALWDLVNETPLPPNPYRNADRTLSVAALRGKVLFADKGGCVNCHIGEQHGGTKKLEWIGTTPEGVQLDVPHLVGAYESAPYLHDGRAQTLEEIFTKYNPKHLHGNGHVLSPSELHDVLEYVREL